MGARHPLPYAFAKANTLLLEDDGEQLVLWAGDRTPTAALAEVTRLFAVQRFERETEGTLGQRIAEAYAGGEGSAAAVMGEVESGVDLSRMMQDLPAVEDLLEAADDAPIIRMLNALLTQAAKSNLPDVNKTINELPRLGSLLGAFFGGFAGIAVPIIAELILPHLPKIPILQPLIDLLSKKPPPPQTYTNSFSATPIIAGRQYRSPSISLKPRVPGPQTATVFGATDEDVSTARRRRLNASGRLQWRLGPGEQFSLQPFLIEPGGGPLYRFRRNPYFHRLDPYGMQLPYIDAIEATVVEPGLIGAKTAAGDSDLQARGLSFADTAALKAARGSGGFRVLLWPVTKGSQVALYPNLTTLDAAWRALLRDRRFRQALSAAIDRDDINNTLFFSLATPGNNTALKESPLYSAERTTREAVFDIAKANALLDEMGLTQRDGSGLRLMPDGRKLEIVVETSGESAEESQVLQLIAPTWRQAGIGLVVRPYERDVLRNRAYAGESVMTVWSGLDNGVPNPSSEPDEIAPVRQETLSWPRWGQFVATKGKSGEAADTPEARRLLELYAAWTATTDDAERTRIWTEMLDINAAEQFSIGTVSGVLQPVVVSNALRNVPETGVFGWDPGAQFGIYRIDAFWLDR